MNFFEGKQGIFFGDSLIQGIGVLPGGENNEIPTDDVVSQLAKILNCNIVNAGIGGTGMSDGECGFNQMVDALLTGDYTNQFSIAKKFVENYGSSFGGLSVQMEKMKSLKPENIDFICIAYGTNDWTYGVDMDNPDDLFDSNTVCGALRKGIRKIMEKLPETEIYVFTPTFRIWKDVDSDSIKNDKTGLSLREVSEGIKEAGNGMHVPCANMYIRSMINKYNWEHFTVDGSHRNPLGYGLLAKQYAKFMLSH